MNIENISIKHSINVLILPPSMKKALMQCPDSYPSIKTFLYIMFLFFPVYRNAPLLTVLNSSPSFKTATILYEVRTYRIQFLMGHPKTIPGKVASYSSSGF